MTICQWKSCEQQKCSVNQASRKSDNQPLQWKIPHCGGKPGLPDGNGRRLENDKEPTRERDRNPEPLGPESERNPEPAAGPERNRNPEPPGPEKDRKPEAPGPESHRNPDATMYRE